MKYEATKLVLQRQLTKYQVNDSKLQSFVYQAIISTYLKTLGTQFGYDATVEILNAAMRTCPNATRELNQAKVMVQGD